MQSKTLTFFIFLAYLYLGVFSLFVMLGHHNMPMTDCPYMTGQRSVCAMDAFEHLTAWKTFNLTIPSSIYILALLVVVISSKILFYISPPLLRQLSYFRKLKLNPIISKQELAFARGIVNPKPY